MTELILVGLVVVSIGVAAYYGYQYSQVLGLAIELKQRVQYKNVVIEVMKKAAAHQAEIRKDLERISAMKTVDELNVEYNKILGML